MRADADLVRAVGRDARVRPLGRLGTHRRLLLEDRLARGIERVRRERAERLGGRQDADAVDEGDPRQRAGVLVDVQVAAAHDEGISLPLGEERVDGVEVLGVQHVDDRRRVPSLVEAREHRVHDVLIALELRRVVSAEREDAVGHEPVFAEGIRVVRPLADPRRGRGKHAEIRRVGPEEPDGVVGTKVPLPDLLRHDDRLLPLPRFLRMEHAAIHDREIDRGDEGDRGGRRAGADPLPRREIQNEKRRREDGERFRGVDRVRRGRGGDPLPLHLRPHGRAPGNAVPDASPADEHEKEGDRRGRERPCEALRREGRRERSGARADEERLEPRRHEQHDGELLDDEDHDGYAELVEVGKVFEHRPVEERKVSAEAHDRRHERGGHEKPFPAALRERGADRGQRDGRDAEVVRIIGERHRAPVRPLAETERPGKEEGQRLLRVEAPAGRVAVIEAASRAAAADRMRRVLAHGEYEDRRDTDGRGERGREERRSPGEPRAVPGPDERRGLEEEEEPHEEVRVVGDLHVPPEHLEAEHDRQQPRRGEAPRPRHDPPREEQGERHVRDGRRLRTVPVRADRDVARQDHEDETRRDRDRRAAPERAGEQIHPRAREEIVDEEPRHLGEPEIPLQGARDERGRIDVRREGEALKARHAAEEVGVPQRIGALGELLLPDDGEVQRRERVGNEEQLALKHDVRKQNAERRDEYRDEHEGLVRGTQGFETVEYADALRPGARG